MHNTRLPAYAAMSAIVGLLGLPTPSMGQAAPPDINPIFACNVTSDTVKGSTPPAATPIEPKLLTSGQPCDRFSDGPLLFPGENLRSIQHTFDFYSWLTFLALNAPAAGGQIGPNVRTMWEDIKNYRQLANVMLPHGAKPSWGTRPPLPPACRGKGSPDTMVVTVEEEAFNQPFKSGPLIDQNGHYALFDILMNKPMFDYMLIHGLYSVKGQQAFPDTVDFPSGNSTGFKGIKPVPNTPGHMGAVMIKVSWKIMDPIKDRDRMSKFHTVDALVYLPGPPDTKHGPACAPAKLGMIGFHVGHKTDFAPQWIWTTFEHIKNVPNQKDVDAGKLAPPYNFYDPACKTCLVNEVPVAQPWDPNMTFLFPHGFKSQITRMEPVLPDAVDMNNGFHKLVAGTVWENYELVSTQWPSNQGCTQDPELQKIDSTCAPVPSTLANSTLETFSQALNKGSVPIATSSCMACHNDATTRKVPAATSDFTFMLEKAH